LRLLLSQTRRHCSHRCSQKSSLSITHNLLKQKIREIDLDRDRNLRQFDMRAPQNIKIEEKTHVQRGPSF
jgi:hypothetical protein